MIRFDDTDTTTYLWDYYFKVSVPQVQATSLDYMRVYGNYITGDKGVDREVAMQWLTTSMPIHRMVDLYKEGSQIKIINQADVKTIYEYISRHLTAWRSRLERGINIGGAPFEDLIALDQFAHAVYEHAKYHFSKDVVESILAQELSSLVRWNTSSLFPGAKAPTNPSAGVPEVTRINADEPKDDYPERDSLSRFLKDRIHLVKQRRF